MRTCICLPLLIVVLLWVGCGGGSSPSPSRPAPALVSIAVTASSSTVALGLTTQLTATGTYSDGTSNNLTSSVTWASSAPGIATISSTGLLTSKAVGTITVTATQGSVSGSTNFAVSQAALVSIAITPSGASVPAGLKVQLNATGTFTDGSSLPLNSVNWSSSDPTLASAASNGVITTYHQGSVSITAASGQISGSAPLIIAAPALGGIMVSPPSASLFVGASTPLSFLATGHYTDGSTTDLSSSVQWNQTVPFVASVDATGKATANRTGYTEVYAALGNISSGRNARLTLLAHPRYAFLTSDANRVINRATIDGRTGRLRWEGYKTTLIVESGSVVNSAFECATADPDSKFLYVAHSIMGSASTGKVEIYTLDNSRGSLTAIAGSPLAVGAPIGCINFEPSGKFGYAAASYNNTTNNQLVTFSRDANTGLLTLINSISLPSHPGAPAIDPTGSFLYVVAQYFPPGSQALAYGYIIDPATGVLTPITGTPFQVPNGAGAFTFHPNGRLAYLAETAGHSIDAYSVNTTTGALTFVDAISPCINPTTLRFSPSGGNPLGMFAYSACSADNNHTPNSATVQGFSVAPNGGLVPVNSAPGPNAPFDVHIDPIGDYLYLTANGNYIHEYRLNKFTGNISAIGRNGAHAMPRSMLLTGGSAPVSYTPQYAFISSTGDNKITSYAVATDGTFSNPQSVISHLGPFSLSAVPWGNQLLAASAGPKPALTPYSVSSTGALTPGFSFGQSATSAGVVMDPSGIWAIDVDAANNGLYTYGDSGGGFWNYFSYHPASGPDVSLFPTGTTPGPIAIDSAGRYVFVGNQDSNSITVFEHWDSMELFERTSAYTAPYSDGSPYALPASPLRIAVDPNGAFLYVLCSDGTVQLFSIDYYSGAHLAPVASTSLAGTPAGLAVMPAFNLFFAADSNGVHGYSVDPGTGAITAGGPESSLALTNVNGVYSDPSGQFLYVTTSTTGVGAVYAYRVDSAGQLTAVNASPVATPNQPSSVAFRSDIR